jgi:DNA-binding NarL/FixJ family response regulator
VKSALTGNTTQIILAENRILFRIGMRKSLDEASGIEVTHQVDTYEGLSRYAETMPDVVVIGWLGDMAEPSAAAQRFLDSRPSESTSVLIVDDAPDLSGRVPPDMSRVGVLPSHSSPDEFLSAIRMLAAGYTFVAQSNHRDILESKRADREESLLQQVTRRETDVLRLLVCGRTNSEVAKQLSLTESTVKFHVQSLLRKLCLPNRASAVAYAYEAGLINVGESYGEIFRTGHMRRLAG